MTRFADTFFYLAVLNARDPAHAPAVALSRGFRGKIVTTEFVLLELADAMAPPPARRAFIRFHESLRADAALEIVPASHDLWERGCRLYTDRPDKHWSLTDCTSFIVMQDLGISEALTGDHHFEQAGFVAMLK